MLLDEILKRNSAFVAGRQPEPLPAAESLQLAVVACFDPRLDPLLRPALGLAEGRAFMIRTAGALLRPDSSPLRSLALAAYLFEVDQVLVVGHSSCRMASFDAGGFIDAFRRRKVTREAFGDGDLRHWAGAIASPRDGVLTTAAAIAGAPFLPPDLTITGVVLDDTTGGLEVVLQPGEPPPRLPSPGATATTGEATDGADEEPREPDPEGGREPAAPAPAAGPPPVPGEASRRGLAKLSEAAHRLSTEAGGADLRRLRAAYREASRAPAKLAVLEDFFRRARADSPEVSRAFSRLRQQAEKAGRGTLSQAISDLFTILNKTDAR